MNARKRKRGPTAATALLAPALLAGVAEAQLPPGDPPAGTDEFVLTAAAIGSGGGAATSAGYAGAFRAGPPGSERTSTAGYTLTAHRPGAAFLPSTPVVFGTSPAVSAFAGGSSASVVGFGFAASPVSDVRVGGGSVGGLVAVSNTRLDVTVPAGADGFGNPLGSVAVEVDQGAHTATRDGAHVFGPALVQESLAEVGSGLQVRYHGGLLDQVLLALGQDLVPALALSFPGIGGALELDAGLLQLTPLLPTVSGALAFGLEVPDSPALAGATLELQGFAITPLAPTLAQFTNVLDVHVQ